MSIVEVNGVEVWYSVHQVMVNMIFPNGDKISEGINDILGTDWAHADWNLIDDDHVKKWIKNNIIVCTCGNPSIGYSIDDDRFVCSRCK